MSEPRIFEQEIELSPDARHDMLVDCWAADPHEAVGLLMGRGRCIEAAVGLVNHARARGRFAVDGGEVTAARASAALQGLAIVGRYHSHPNGPATPSRSDQASLPTGWVEVIVQLRQGPAGPRLIGIHAFDKLARRLPLITPAGPDEVPA